MLYEYAVDPQAIGENWDTFRYVIEKFGFDKGRLISTFPRNWFDKALLAVKDFRPVDKLRAIEALNIAKQTKVVGCGQSYDLARNWLDNALRQLSVVPFRAIVAMENPTADAHVILVRELDELSPLMKAPRDVKVERDAKSLTGALALMLKFGRHILFVDPYYDPYSPRYQSTFRDCLGLVKRLNPTASCEIHHLDRDGEPTAIDFEREAKHLFGRVIPAGLTVTIYRWREKKGGEDFHARYLLTNKGGIRVDAGFSAEGRHQTTDMALLDFDFSQAIRRTLARGAGVYELVEPVLQVASTGWVDHV